MGIYDRDYYRDDPPQAFSWGGGRTMVTNLLIINVAVFVIDALFASPAERDTLGGLNRFLAVTPETVRQPWYWWRFLTYGFAHGGPMHIAGNMIGLFFFGRAIEGVYGSRKFLGMYLTAVLAGSLVWACPLYFTAPALAKTPLVGASGAIVAVILLFCFHFPKQTVLFMMVIPMPAWLLGVLIIVLDVTGQLGNKTDIAYSVHLAGAAYAYLFYRTQFELGQFVSADWMNNLRRLKTRPKLRVHNPRVRSADDQIDRQADAILEKLHREGEASLTASERRTLEEYSRRMKHKHR